MSISPRVSRKLTASLSPLLLTSPLVVAHLLASTPVSAAATPACVAGTDYVETTDGSDTVLVFSNTSTCEWAVPAGLTSVDLLLVGGGGGGGARVGGGGGGGAVVTQTSVNLAFPTYTITVGRGGTGARFDLPGDNTFHQGSNGGGSFFNGGGVTLTAAGGGVGGSWDGSAHSQLPGSGGSGGGSGATTSAGVGNPGGNGGVAADDSAPHAAGGGGGAGSAGLNGLENSSTDARGGDGGLGVSSDIVVRGTRVLYGGGGGGSVHGSWTNVALTTGTYIGGDGIDGGGNGGAPTTSASTVYGGHGTDGLGGGGGGAANSGDSLGSIGGDGGDGVVILRWLTVVPTATPPASTTPTTPIWRATLDPNGGTCIDGTPRNILWTSMFIGYRYLPDDTDCVRPGHTLTGWAPTTDPATPITLPEIVDPRDGERRAFLAANADLIAVWTKNPAPITALTVFANFLCGPCTTVWLIHSPADDDVTVDITVGDEPASCNTYAEAFDLSFCELTPLTPGTHTITLTPRHGTVVGDPTRTVVALRN